MPPRDTSEDKDNVERIRYQGRVDGPVPAEGAEVITVRVWDEAGDGVEHARLVCQLVPFGQEPGGLEDDLHGRE